jgi:hypothetical protein
VPERDFMNDQAFIIQPKDQPIIDGAKDRCSRCAQSPVEIVAEFRWNIAVFRYCAKCAEGK